MPLDMRIINNVQHRNRQHIKNVTITLASKQAGYLGTHSASTFAPTPTPESWKPHQGHSQHGHCTTTAASGARLSMHQNSHHSLNPAINSFP